jgi:hypothetical protein
MQVRIAQRMGRSEGWVSRRLLFGRFLHFLSDRQDSFSPPQTLTEWRFRDHWRKAGKGHAKETEADRFARVLTLLQENKSDLPKNYGNLVKKPGIKKAVIEALEGTKRLDVASITELVNETLPEVDKQQVTAAIQNIQRHPPKGMAFEARHNGRYHKYRLIEAKRRDGPVPLVDPERAGAMAVDALPLLDECIEIMKQPVVGRQQTLALDHLSRVTEMIRHLLLPAEVV